mmetsp:Transcript_35338/g.63147  ORF Transcript_35338/g.63147 Transcript_35338/m.63147 type:complete len:213 (-) Transcript_35338:72-710(-)
MPRPDNQRFSTQLPPPARTSCACRRCRAATWPLCRPASGTCTTSAPCPPTTPRARQNPTEPWSWPRGTRSRCRASADRSGTTRAPPRPSSVPKSPAGGGASSWPTPTLRGGNRASGRCAPPSAIWSSWRMPITSFGAATSTRRLTRRPLRTYASPASLMHCNGTTVCTPSTVRPWTWSGTSAANAWTTFFTRAWGSSDQPPYLAMTLTAWQR